MPSPASGAADNASNWRPIAHVFRTHRTERFGNMSSSQCSKNRHILQPHCTPCIGAAPAELASARPHRARSCWTTVTRQSYKLLRDWMMMRPLRQSLRQKTYLFATLRQQSHSPRDAAARQGLLRKSAPKSLRIFYRHPSVPRGVRRSLQASSGHPPGSGAPGSGAQDARTKKGALAR